jgi:hypothetical protein
MVAFGKQYGFVFLCHELGHCNRKAGEERSFWTVETNFLPGRTFESLADLNRQAFEWATVRMHHRPVGKAGLIPAKAFEHEQSFLTKLPAELPSPYCSHERGTDQYGYAQFRGNYYWVPGTKREPVKVFEYADRLKIYQHGKLLAEYPLPEEHVTNQRFSPPGQPRPRSWPQNQRRSSEPEEQRLRAMSPAVADYVEFAVKSPGVQRHRFVRELFALSRKVTRDVFLQTVERALKYRVADMRSLHRIAWYCQSQGGYLFDVTGSDLFIDEDFRDRPAYREGCLTDEPDLSRYDEPDGDTVVSDDESGVISDDESDDEPPPDEGDDPVSDDIPW